MSDLRDRALIKRRSRGERIRCSDDYELISGGGGRVSGEDYLGGIESGELRYAVLEPAAELAVRAYADVAVVRYLARTEVHFAGGRDTGLFWHIDVYEQRDAAWQVFWSRATPDPDTRARGYQTTRDR